MRYTKDMAGSEIIADCTGFDCYAGNLLKNWEKHGVSAAECEQVFFNRPLITGADKKHSRQEARFYGLGQTDAGRHLFIVFTIRNNLIRVISARDMNQKEKKAYRKS